MKKKVFAALFAILLIFVCSCSNQIDPSNDSSGGAGGGELGKIFIQQSLGGEVEPQIWTAGETCTLDFEDSSILIKGKEDQAWIGCALASKEGYFDFTNVHYVRLDATGTIPLNRAKIYVIARSIGHIGDEKAVNEYIEATNEVSGDGNYNYTILIPLSKLHEEGNALYLTNIGTILALSVDNPSEEEQLTYEDPLYVPGEWIRLSNIDYLDSSKNHVDIKKSEGSVSTGTYSNIFSTVPSFNLNLYSWENTCDFVLTENGLKVTAMGGTWFGGSFNTDDGVYVDYREVESLSFKVRGNMKTEDFKICFTSLGFDCGTSIYDLDTTKAELSETEYYEYTISSINSQMTETQKVRSNNVLTFKNSDGHYAGDGAWIEFKDVTYKDSRGNAITLQAYSAEEEATAGFEVLFKNLSIPNEAPIDIQVWEGTFDASMTKEGLKVIPTGGTWFGGGIVNAKANQGESDYESFDFSKVCTVEFDIKGDILPSALRFAFSKRGQADLGIAEVVHDAGTLENLGLTSISTTTETHVKITIPENKFTDTVDMPLRFTQGSDGWQGRYFIISNVDYKDASGNSIALTYAK